MNATKSTIAAAALLGASAAANAQDNSTLTDPINAIFDRNSVGTTAQTGSEIIQCRSYWTHWQRSYESVIPAAGRANLDKRLQPEATAAALAWHDAKFEEEYGASGASGMQQRMNYTRKYRKEAAENLAKWQADNTQLGFFSWLGSCGTRD